ncbi:MAG: CrcB family protein [Candidatus Nanopelagicaceae bacterium]|nr:CrcB family protein [Candidatus Nanopelagicaceae bacterium]
MRLASFLIGAFIGAPTRYVIDQYFRSYMKFPTGILIVNLAGSFLLGLSIDSQTDLAYGLMGFCGALTTWSAFALDLFNELEEKDWKRFAVNLMSNYTLGVLAALTGIYVVG